MQTPDVTPTLGPKHRQWVPVATNQVGLNCQFFASYLPIFSLAFVGFSQVLCSIAQIDCFF